jgi:undecaprenyl-diphosphatase
VAAEFSFLMSIVVIAGSGVLQIRHIPPGTDLLAPGLIWAFVAALVSGVAAIKLLVALLRSSKFHLFAPYCAALGILCLVWFGWLGR